jgi:serine/threonine-protein kinase
MLQAGTILNDTYEIKEKIGVGGGGEVYKAYHERLKCDVVVKQIKENVKGILESRAEADILKSLKHTYLPRVYDFLEIDGEIYTVMDFIPGRNLSQEIKSGRVFTEEEVLKWMHQLAEALAYLHSLNPPVVHSDIKPANIMLTPEGNICLIDFNISLAFDKNLRTSTGISGGYSAPEQYNNIEKYMASAFADIVPRSTASALRGGEFDTSAATELLQTESLEATEVLNTDMLETEVLTEEEQGACVTVDTSTFTASDVVANAIGRGVDERTDIYSLGATMYHILTGIKPSNDFDRVVSITECDVKVREGLLKIITKMMQLDPKNRYANGGELLYALDHIYELEAEYRAKVRKRRVIILAVVLAVAAIIAITAGIVSHINKEKSDTYNRVLENAVANIESYEFENAESCINEALGVLPDRVDAYADYARLIYVKGDYEGCIDYCRDVINNPAYQIKSASDEAKLGDIYYILGNAYLNIKDYSNAAVCLEKAINHNEHNSLYYRDYAIAKARMGNLEEADNILESAVEKGLGKDSIYMVQGEISFVKMEYTEAEELLKKAISTAESAEISVRATNLLADVYKALGDAYIDDEITLLERSISESNGQASLEIIESLGEAYTRKAKADSANAKNWYNKAISAFEDIYGRGYVSYQVMENLAILYEDTNEFVKSEEILKEAAEKYPNDYRPYKRLAFLEADKQQYKANENRNYRKMAEYYDLAVGKYKIATEAGTYDAEMQILDNLMRDIKAGGWL